MADWRDVMQARGEARDARNNASAYGGAIEEGRTSDPSLAILLAAEAVCAELRALSVLLDHVGDSARDR